MLVPIVEKHANCIDTEKSSEHVLHALLEISQRLGLVHGDSCFLDGSYPFDQFSSLLQFLDVQQHSADHTAKKPQISDLRVIEAIACGASVLGHKILKSLGNKSDVADERFLVF